MLPHVMTILPTYKCTAACKECCFECSPQVEGRIPLDRILKYINEGADSIPTLKLVCFSGGESFLLGKDLDAAIALAHSRGLRTRCVTNGYWATTPEAAMTRMLALKEAGLDELNISTGDDHIAFVPFERAVNGAIAGADLKIISLIVIEGFTNSKFKLKDAQEHPRIQAYLKHPNAPYLQVMQNIWMPFHADRELEHDENLYRKVDRSMSQSGCHNVLINMVVTPDESLASCCGLTMEHIPEMKLGKLADHSILELVDRGMKDFLKIWIWLDGPEALLEFASKKDPRVKLPKKNVHPCETCAQFYLDPLARDVLREHWREVRDDVLMRYEFKVNLTLREERLAALRLRRDDGVTTRIGHGDC
jgi:organic radical activating enzyme